MTWIVNTNSEKCYVYHFDVAQHKLNLLFEITHTNNHLRYKDYRTAEKSPAHDDKEPHSPSKKIETDYFAREVAGHLNAARNKNEIDKLIVISAAEFNGILKKHFDKPTLELVEQFIQKDVVDLNTNDLLKLLDSHKND